MPRFNEFGGLIVRQSDLSAYARCAQQKYLGDKMESEGRRELTLSATVYGTVVHHALETFERLHHEGRADALDVALATFLHYWLPENVGEMEPGGIDIWLPRQTYGGLREKGQQAIRTYAEMIKSDDGTLLALEYQFTVPLTLGGRQHTFTGTADRLSQRKHLRKAYLNVEDFKTGRVPTYLRYNMQFSAYAWASTQRAFWDGFDDPERAFELTRDWARRGTWIDMATVTRKDAGWRGPQDYARLMVALAEYIKAVESEVYPLSISGAVCMYCPFGREHPVTKAPAECGGVALPDEDEGRP